MYESGGNGERQNPTNPTMTDMTYDEYRAELDSSAKTSLDEIESYTDIDIHSDRFEDELVESLGATAEWHQWTTYSGYSLDILEHAINEPEEWHLFIDEEQKNNHRAVLDAMAYSAFRMDLYQIGTAMLKDRRESLLAA